MSNQNQDLLEELGGPEEIYSLIEEMYARVYADQELAPFFEGVEKDRLAKMQFEFISSALGGPVKHSGADLRAVHHGKGITPKHYALFIGHLLSAMKDRQIDESTADRVLAELALYRDKIVGTPTVDG